MKSRKNKNNVIEILLAEDSPTQAEKLRNLLEEHGFAVATAGNGKEALASLQRRRPALVVSDILMPKLDGYGLCKAIKSDEKLKDIPVVLVTTLSDPQDVIRGLECGADNFICKPYDERDLLSRIDYLLMNLELRKDRRTQLGLEINLGGRRYFITAERQQILDLLVSTYEQAIHINERLKAVNKELEAFSYSVSHDLRAPLRHVDGFSQALQEEYAGRLDAHGQDYLQRIRRAIQRMGELIDDLLRLSRVTQADLRHERIDLSGLARAVAAELRKTQPERRVEFVIAPALTAEGDARLLRVVLENLLGNAWKFTHKRSRARIEFGATRHEGQRAYFVRDDGAGFDMAYAGKLFGAFQRLHDAHEYPGTGIGLATVQRVIHKHGGRVWAEGAVDKGAIFYFTL